MMQTVIFYFLALVTVASAVLVVSLKNVFHCALFLILALLGVAGNYAMLAADFLFAAQLLVYAGGIMVILLFVVLLSGKPTDWLGKQENEEAWIAGLCAVFMIVILSICTLTWVLPNTAQPAQVTTAKLGALLLGDMVLPFEAISLVLVAALVGAIFYSQKKES